MRLVGRAIVLAWLLVAVFAPWLAPYAPSHQFPDAAYAPPTRVHLWRAGAPATPYIHRVTLVDPLARTFSIDESSVVPLVAFSRGHVLTTGDSSAPLFLLGADGLGRDLFSRIVYGARLSMIVACAALFIAVLLGAIGGVTAGYVGGVTDQVLMRLAEFTIVLPVLYVVLALRAAMPVQLSTMETVVLMALVFALVSWPMTARGVREIVAAERTRDYVAAAEALGAGPLRIMLRHLAPAAAGFIATQSILLLPMLIIAEATLSFAGLGLPDDAPGWGTLIQEAGNLGALGTAPWLVAPAVALFSLVLGVNLSVERSSLGLAADTTLAISNAQLPTSKSQALGGSRAADDTAAV
jgi:peptide/nickel transport system permease protein